MSEREARVFWVRALPLTSVFAFRQFLVTLVTLQLQKIPVMWCRTDPGCLCLADTGTVTSWLNRDL